MIKKVVSFDNDEFAFELIQAMADDNHAKFNELLRTWVDIHGLSRSQYGGEQEALSNFM